MAVHGPVNDLGQLGTTLYCVPIGDQIREARQRAGLSQPALAKLVNVGKNTISNWETGATSPKDKIAKVRDVLRDTWDEDEPPRLNDEEVWLSRVDHNKLLRELGKRLDEAGSDRKPGTVRPSPKDFLGRPGPPPPDLPLDSDGSPQSG